MGKIKIFAHSALKAEINLCIIIININTGNIKGGTVDLLFDWFGISCMTTDKFCFYLQNRLIQTGQTGGQQYIKL